MTRTSSFQSTDVSFCRRGSRSSDYYNKDPAGSPSTVPVQDPGGRLIAAMSSSGPVEKHPRDEVEGQAEAVRRTAAALGRSLPRTRWARIWERRPGPAPRAQLGSRAEESSSAA